MSDYLWRKCKGKYRVLPELDPRTNDVPRDKKDSIDPDYDDYYIPSNKCLIVKHGYRDELSCIIESNKTASSILKTIYMEQVNKKLPSSDPEVLSKALIKSNILLEVDIMDGEVFISFKLDKLDSLAKILSLRKKGSKVHPMSKKNLYTQHYTIPQKDLDTYKNIIGVNDVEDSATKLKIGRTVRKLTIAFLDSQKYEDEQTKMGLDNKEFIHATGRWETYLKYLKKQLKEGKK